MRLVPDGRFPLDDLEQQHEGFHDQSWSVTATHGDRSAHCLTAKIVLAVDLSGSLKGYAELTITPTHEGLRSVYLNCRQCDISNVSLNGKEKLSYQHNDALAPKADNPTFKPTHPDDLPLAYPELKRKLYSAINEGDEGELIVLLPEGVVKPAEGSTEAAPVFETIVLVIDYELVHPRDGVRFAGQDSEDLPHVYTHAANPDGARCWMPCVDTLWDRCSWELLLITPRFLKIVVETESTSQEDVVEELPVIAIASAELVEQVAHPQDPRLVVWRYEQPVLTSAQHMGFAVGPFHIQDLGAPGLEDAPLTEDGKAKMHAFCLPGYEAELENSVSFMRRALDFLTTEYGSYPFGSYKLVFIDDPDFSLGNQTVHNTASMTTYTSDLLYPATIIEQGLETRQALSYGLASQWSGISIVQKTFSDTWLVNGIALRLASLVLKDLLGANDYRYKLKKDIQRCCEADIFQPPLCEPGIDHPLQSDVLAFVNLKAPLVLHIIDQKLLKSGQSHGLSRILPKIFLSAISGELKGSVLSTHTFLRICRKVSGVDLRPFAEQWVYSSGCPRFKVRAQFSRKKMAVELHIEQVVPAWEASTTMPWQEVGHINPIQLFEGQMTVRVHEADGTPYEHVLDIRDKFKRHDVPFNTKYKRIRRQTKRYQARAEALKSGAVQVQGQQEAEEELQLIDMGYGLDIWEDDVSRREWRLLECDWNEEEESAMAAATYEWIRLDAEFDWIAILEFQQPDFMWVSQLARDRDVIAQIEAVQALEKIQSKVVASTLAKTVLTTNYYYGIRVDACLALVRTCISSLDYIGLFFLLKIYQTRFCYAPAVPSLDPFLMQLNTKPNDFSDFPEYFVRLALITTLSKVREDNGGAPPFVTRFLTRLLTLNDNSTNPYSDTAYLATIFSALSEAFLAIKINDPFGGLDLNEMQITASLTANAVDEISRYVNLDRLVPSYRNLITLSGLEWKFKMMFAGMVPADLKTFFSYSREGNYTAVRALAFECLLLLRGLNEPSILNYVLMVLRFDKSPLIRHRLAESFMTCLPILGSIEDIGQPQIVPAALTIEEEDASAIAPSAPKPLAASVVFDVQTTVQSIRQDHTHSFSLPSQLLAILKDPNTDLETRFYIFKVCETLYQPGAEPVPKLKLRMPLPVSAPTEVPANNPLPRIKLFAGARPPPIEESAVVQLPEQDLFTDLQLNGPVQEVAEPRLTLQNRIRPGRKGQGADKKAKKPKVLKSQAKGMPLDDVKACRNCLKKILADKTSEMFRFPVDPTRDNAPGYFTVIRRPMDLMTVQASLESGQYTSREEFKNDILQIVDNAHKYNGLTSPIGTLATKFQLKFEKVWSRIESTVAATQEKRSKIKLTVPPPPPPAEMPQPYQARANFRLKLSSSSAHPSTEESAVVSLPDLGDPRPPLRDSAAYPQQSTSSLPSLPSAIKPTLKLSLGGPKKPKKVTIQDDFQQPLPTEATPSAVDDPVVPSAPAEGPEPAVQPSNGVNVLDPSPSIPVAQSLPLETNPAPVAVTFTQPVMKSYSPAPLTTDPSPAVVAAMPAPAPHSIDPPPNDAYQLSSTSNGSIQPSELARSSSVPSPSGASPAPPLAAAPFKLKVKLKPSFVPPSNQSEQPVRVKSETPRSASPAAPRQSTPLRLSEDPSSRQQSVGPAPWDPRKAKTILTEVYNMDEAGWFRVPVDPVASGCPTYYDEIKSPMDLTTIWNKLENGAYQTLDAMTDDFRLMVSNCHRFNGPTSLPSQFVDKVLQRWLSRWSSSSKKNSAPSGHFPEKKRLQSLLRQLTKDDLAITGGIFQVPVDPIALGIPHYFDVIPRETARDLSTIKSKLDKDAYKSVDDFTADMNLMIDNALKFNPPSEPVHQNASNYRNHFEQAMRNFASGGVKRSGSALGGSSKKAKYS